MQLEALELRDILEDVPEFILSLIEHPNLFLKSTQAQRLSLDDLDTLTHIIIKRHKKTPNYVKLSRSFHDVCIVGDLHGDFTSLYNIVQPFFDEKVKSLIFLGDYVDRGKHSLLTLMFVIGMMLAWPKNVIALRGNHEDRDLNQFYGFEDELNSIYGSQDTAQKVLDYLEMIYDYLSLAALTPQKSICIHGGIPKNLHSIKDINQIPKPHSSVTQIEDSDVMKQSYKHLYQIRWNDPSEDQKQRFQSSDRGPNSLIFNEEVITDFLENSEAKRIIRSHESFRGGFEALFNGKLLHIFSNQPYFGRVQKAYMIHEQKDKQTVLRDLNFNIVRNVAGSNYL